MTWKDKLLEVEPLSYMTMDNNPKNYFAMMKAAERAGMNIKTKIVDGERRVWIISR